ncbi:hypothetical protein GOBAR_DD13116 [Gossypium barbadense]|nr:hypothetical protein GOBAR_DD13116 [Gossypium barbadense]
MLHLALLFSIFVLVNTRIPGVYTGGSWETAHVTFYGGSDASGTMGLNSARIYFTCHNFEYQGTASASELASCGLDAQELNRPDRMQDKTAHDSVNPVKGAIVFSNIVMTVSPTYAQEVRIAEGGKGLHSTLNSHTRKFMGILNGINTDAWNPRTDNFLKVQYSANDKQGKAENKAAMRRNLGLSSADDQRPVGLAKLPFIDEEQLLAEVAKIEHTLTDEEAQRNSTVCDMLFVAASHRLSEQIFSLDSRKQLPERQRIEVKEEVKPNLRWDII